MAKKKTKQRKSNKLPEQPLTPEISPKIDYHRPLSSCYEFPLVTLIIGNKQYGIPAQFLRNYQKFEPAFFGLSTFIMSDIDEDIGHTVVHFLYTGGYETVCSPLGEGTSDLAREYKRSVLVYYASRTWGLTNLEILARQKMLHLDEELPVLEILRVVREVFSSLPADETWLPDYIQGNLQRSLRPNDPGLGLQEFYDVIGQDHQFDNAVMKMIIEILSIRIFSMKEQQQVKAPNGIISTETPLQELVSERLEHAPAEIECSPDEPESVPEEPGPVPEEPESVPEKSESVPEEPESVPEEPGPVPEEPDSVPEEPESVPDEPEPAPEKSESVPDEPEPAPEKSDSVPEEPESVPDEPEPAPGKPETVLEETEYPPEKPESFRWGVPVEADSGLGVVPRVSADPGDWPRSSSLPENTPNAELQEASGQGHITKISCSDLALYENWKSLSLKKRAKRASKLRSRGLPVPSKTGFIAIVAD